jgi:hypothetical protein
MGGPTDWEFGEGLKVLHRQKPSLIRNVTQGLGIARILWGYVGKNASMGGS